DRVEDRAIGGAGEHEAVAARLDGVGVGRGEEGGERGVGAEHDRAVPVGGGGDGETRPGDALEVARQLRGGEGAGGGGRDAGGEGVGGGPVGRQGEAGGRGRGGGGALRRRHGRGSDDVLARVVLHVTRGVAVAGQEEPTPRVVVQELDEAA